MLLQKKLSLSDCEIKFSGDEARTFTGYASVFDVVDEQNDIVKPGAFSDVVKAGKPPKMYVEHNWMAGKLPIGKYTNLIEDNRGLIVEGQFTPGHTDAENAHAALKHGTVDGLSVGMFVDRDHVEKDGNVRHIKRVASLLEVSLVAMPANQSARVDLSTVKSALHGIDNIRDFEQFLRDTGNYSKSSATAIVATAKAIFADRGDPEETKRTQRLAELSNRLNTLSMKIEA